MKKFIAIALLALFTTACTPTENAGMMDKGMMCEKCPCCQKMMEGGMKDGMMKVGIQCPMMKDGAKKGKSCACCVGMQTSSNSDAGMKMPCCEKCECCKEGSCPMCSKAGVSSVKEDKSCPMCFKKKKDGESQNEKLKQ